MFQVWVSNTKHGFPKNTSPKLGIGNFFLIKVDLCLKETPMTVKE